MEFKAFPKIEHYGKLHMTITQKIHGSNAQVYIEKILQTEATHATYLGQPDSMTNIVTFKDEYYRILAGSRTRWLTLDQDNFGFAAFVYLNQLEFVEKLGPGQHFGEWAGPGINSGEGLTQKTFVLFDWWKFPSKCPLPPQTVVVPVLHSGAVNQGTVDAVMADLQKNGSRLVPGFMRPEGVVITVAGTRYKKVFEAEETQWRGSDGKKERVAKAAASPIDHLLQPHRLEKLLSRDEKYGREYPASLPQICADYIADLVAEGQIGGSEDEQKVIRKALGSKLFSFVKELLR